MRQEDATFTDRKVGEMSPALRDLTVFQVWGTKETDTSNAPHRPRPSLRFIYFH
jgi:hypothetical protein